MGLQIVLQTSLSLCLKQNRYTSSMTRPIFIYSKIELNIICIKKVIIRPK